VFILSQPKLMLFCEYKSSEVSNRNGDKREGIVTSFDREKTKSMGVFDHVTAFTF